MNAVTGDRLPAIRSLAAEYRVAPNTIIAAIDRLRDDGWVNCRRGSGIYVNDLARILEKGPRTAPRGGLPPSAAQAVQPVLHFLFHLESSVVHANSLYTEILVLMQEEADAAGWRLRIGNAAQLGDLLADATPENTAGAIYIPDAGHPYDLRWPRLEFPRVLFSLGEKSLTANYVTPDN